MMIKSIVWAMLPLLLATSALGQEEPCLYPSSYVLHESPLDGSKNLESAVAEFQRKVEELKPEQATVIVFGGKKSKVDFVDKISEKLERLLQINKLDYNRRYFVRDGGFRSTPVLVFWIRPLKCSDYQSPLPELEFDQVEFEGFGTQNTIQQNSADLLVAGISIPRPQCPPAARAVRACINDTPAEVYVLINEKGSVVFAKSITGHPLNRAAAEKGAKVWKFEPYKVDGRSMNRSGIVKITFEEGPELSIH